MQPQDNGAPFSPAFPKEEGDNNANLSQAELSRRHLDPTHPATDSNMQPEEIYEEGVAGAAEATEPNAHNAVVDYHPETDQRQH